MNEEDLLKRAHFKALEFQKILQDKHKNVNELEYNSEHLLRAENLAFDIDVWYPRLRNFTYETVFLPLSLAEATAIIKHYSSVWRSKNNDSFYMLTTDDIFILKRLGDRIDDALMNNSCFAVSDEISSEATIQEKKKRAFVRLCGRSPKDGEPYFRNEIWNTFQENLNLVEAEAKEMLSSFNTLSSNGNTEIICHSYENGEQGPVVSASEVLTNRGNQKLIAISRSATLKIKSGSCALSLLLSSERVYLDMLDWLKYGEPEQIVLRRWEPQMKIEYEFRAFIYKHKMTALSQYDHYCVYPQLEKEKLSILNAIQSSWRDLHSSVGIESYTVDFVYLPETKSAKLVEISPFLPCTGPAMFNWINDADLLKGELPFEFRTRQEMRDQVEELADIWLDRYHPTNVAHYPPYDLQWDKLLFLNKNNNSQTANEGTGIVSYLKNILDKIADAINFNNDDDVNENHGIHEDVGSADYNNESILLFVYGTLKKNFHWHNKFLSSFATFKGHARTVKKFPLVIGDCGVPYVLGDIASDAIGHQIEGECYELPKLFLKGMDDYEGVTKNYYERSLVEVLIDDSVVFDAFMYVKIESFQDLRNREFVTAYSKERHESEYLPIQHILVKQQGYLEYKASTWGLALESPQFDQATS